METQRKNSETKAERQGWIRMIGAAEAEGVLKEIYIRMRSASGTRPTVYQPPSGDAANIVKSHSLEPEGLRLAFGMSGAIHWGPSSLPWAKREMLNTVTSAANNCFYWVSAHAEFLRAATDDGDLAGQLKLDFRKAPLPEKDRCMLEFVDKLTRFPWMMLESDIVSLRQTGFRDVEILHIVLGNAHFNYLNRMADGIGIRFEYHSDLPAFQIQPVDNRDLPLWGEKGRRRPPHADQPIAWIPSTNQVSIGISESGPSNLFQSMSQNSDVTQLAKEWRDYQLRPTSQLDARSRGRLALYVSALNYCEYSVFWYRQFLAQLGQEATTLDSLSRGEQPEGLVELEKLEFEHAKRLTLEPWTTREVHIDRLRQAGLDDSGILQLTMLVSYLSFEIRVALGLGVSIERSLL